MKKWIAKWIGTPGLCMIDWRRKTLPAPEFRQIFMPDHTIEHAEIFISGLGFFEWSINGKKVTEDLLVPSVTEYDKHWRYLRYTLDFPLEKGKTYVFSVTLGNGLYNCQTHEFWHFDKADWRDYPKMIFQLEENGKVLLVSDQHWVTALTGTRYDSFRGGEIHDARLEKPFSMELPSAVSVPRAEIWNPDIQPDENWHYAWVVAPPGGIGVEQAFPGCREFDRNPMTRIAPNIWKAEQNVSGMPLLRVKGKSGASVKMVCGERLSEDGQHVDNAQIGSLVVDEYFQEDTYILKGEGEEEWSPRFTYHGFQYVETVCEGEVEILSLQQKFVYTGFCNHGKISTSNRELMRLEKAATRANLSNFCGNPTDCPHREKNGWTSEAMLMCEPLLYTCNAAQAYDGFITTLIDTQRPSGQISSIAPCAGWGYNWGSGGHWDFALFDIPWTLWLFTGEKTYLEHAFGAMIKNLEYHEMAAEDGISHSLGDWLAPEQNVDPVGAAPTAFRIASILRTLQAARVLGKTEEIPALEKSLAELKRRYNEFFYFGKGIYQGRHSTFSAIALNLDIVPAEDRKLCVEHLVETVRAGKWKVDYGTNGSRQTPLALFENGFAGDAFRLLTQPEYPGYQFMLDRTSTLAEDWNTNVNSLNHGAFSYVVACMYRYLAGFRHSEKQPGPKFLEIAPMIPEGLSDFSAEYVSYRSAWKNENGKVRFEFTVPPGARALVRFPDGTEAELESGNHSFIR